MTLRTLPLLAWTLLAACQGGGDAGSDGTGPDGGTDTDDTFVGRWPPGSVVCASADPDAPIVAAVEPVLTTFEDFDTVYSVPEGARGLMFYFLGGSGVNEAIGPEQTAFQELLLTAGIGWVATARSTPGASAKWDMQEERVAQNPDLARLSRLRDFLLDEHGLPQDTPIVSTGFSDGGAMSLFFARVMSAEGWPIEAVLPHNSGTQDPADLPTFFSASQHDEALVRNAASNMHAELLDRGVVTGLREAEERLVDVPALLRIASWDEAKAQAAIDDLVSVGLIDAQGNRKVTDEQMDPALQGWAANTTVSGAAFAESRIRVLWATHRYNALYAGDECQFVMDALGY